MSWPQSKPATRCEFSICSATLVLVRVWLKARKTLDVPIVDHEVWPTLRESRPTSMMEVEEQETWLCFQHSEVVKLAKKRELTICRSPEGWLWVDNLDYMRFAA